VWYKANCSLNLTKGGTYSYRCALGGLSTETSPFDWFAVRSDVRHVSTVTLPMADGLTTYSKVLAEELMDTQLHNYNSYVLKIAAYV
jgi:hypothetical protein